MKRFTRPGGRHRRVWRLKKKYTKWFSHVIQDLLTDTLSAMPKNYFENAWNSQTYDVCRIYK